MKCSLCGAWFQTHEQTYNPISLPETASTGIWRKMIRGAIKMEGHHPCGPCLKTIQDAIKACKTERRAKVDAALKEEEASVNVEPATVTSGPQDVDIDLLDKAIENAADEFMEEDKD